MLAKSRSRSFVTVLASCTAALALALSFFSTPALANHSWNGYHWARTNNPLALKLASNLNSTWRPYLSTTSSDWNKSSVLRTTIVSGNTTSRCNPTSGRDEICNGAYGQTGWLGVAQIWNDGGGHIAQGTVKVNDTYFNSPPYNTTSERNHVMCQEVGHTFGLDHQDTSGASLGTCMDYSSSTASQHPNAHDYAELVTIYSHTDSYNSSYAPTHLPTDIATADYSAQNQWGTLVRTSSDGRTSTFVRDLGHGYQIVTQVYWAK